MCFLIWYLVYHGCLCITLYISLGYIIYDYSKLFPHTPSMDLYILNLDFLRRFMGSNMVHTYVSYNVFP